MTLPGELHVWRVTDDPAVDELPGALKSFLLSALPRKGDMDVISDRVCSKRMWQVLV